MKLFYDEQGRLSEVIGSGENGDFTDNEEKIFNNYVNKLIDADKELKKQAIDKEAEIQKEAIKTQGEFSKESLNRSSNIWKAVGSVALAACSYLDERSTIQNQLLQNTQPQASESEKK